MAYWHSYQSQVLRPLTVSFSKTQISLARSWRCICVCISSSSCFLHLVSINLPSFLLSRERPFFWPNPANARSFIFQYSASTSVTTGVTADASQATVLPKPQTLVHRSCTRWSCAVAGFPSALCWNLLFKRRGLSHTLVSSMCGEMEPLMERSSTPAF